MTFFALILAIIALRSVCTYLDSKGAKKTVYMANGKKSTQSHLVKYYDTLGLEYNQGVSPEIIRKAYHKQLEFSTDDRLSGYKPIYFLEELQAAKAYLTVFSDYDGGWN